MIPRIQTGTSFAGAGLYYLHDKRLDGEQDRLTDDRVAWTYAINTMENEPEAVLAEMRQTAFDQPLLKMLSGNRIDGRPTEKPVVTVALSWPFGERPTQQEMIEAGHSFLQHMRWEAHQALFVAHNDTKCAHVHLIINAVHPETGMTMDTAWRKIRVQKWALAFEREQGRIYCHAREEKYGRDAGRDASHMTRREWQMWQEISKDNAFEPEFRRKLEGGEWDVLKDSQRDERLAFWKETGAMRNDLRAAVREEVRAEFADRWGEYAKVRAVRDREARTYDREARRAIRELRKQVGTQRLARSKRPDSIAVERAPDGSTYIKTPSTRSDDIAVVRGPDGRTYIKRRRIESEGIERIKESRKVYHAQQREELWQMRSSIATEQKARFAELAVPALEKLSADRAVAYTRVLAEQKEERAELRHDQKQGERRADVLTGLSVDRSQFAVPMTPEQKAAYIEDARNVAARQAEFDAARKETTDAGRSPSLETGRDPLDAKPAKETTDRALVQQGKDRAREASQKADVEFYLKQRAADRARDRGGGRDR